MTVFNRKDKTIECLESLFSSEVDESQLDVFLIDAGSDGTSEVVSSRWPRVHAETTTDSIFWASGMRMAWESAQISDYSILLWLNDDVVLDRQWLTNITCGTNAILTTEILVGGCVDPDSGAPTYGGFYRGPFWGRLRFRAQHVDGLSHQCDTMNGNVVMVPKELDVRLGGFPSKYRHNLADLAYGLDATRAGAKVLLAPNPVGTCRRDSATANQKPDGLLSPVDRLRKAADVKNFPPQVWFLFCLRYGGIVGFLDFAKPYIRSVLGRTSDGQSIEERS